MNTEEQQKSKTTNRVAGYSKAFVIPAWVRPLFGVLLVSLIVFIVVSPYIDLPLSTLPARQATLTLLATLALFLTPVSPVQVMGTPERLRANLTVTDSMDADTAPLTCALLC